MDVTFRTDEGKFNYRACAIFIHGGRLLTMWDDRSPYAYLPGGRVRLGETAEAAVVRETVEELSVEASILRPLWLNQSFFTESVTGQRYHELCLYFLMDSDLPALLDRGDRFTIQEGDRTLTFQWVPFDALTETYLQPAFIKEAVRDLPETLTLRAEYE